MKSHTRVRIAKGLAFACLAVATPAQAQLNTQHIKGTVGLKSGSQAPPGVYFIAPLYYVYKTDEVKDRDGDRLPLSADLHRPAVTPMARATTPA